MIKLRVKKSEKGFALIEALAFLFVFVTLTAYTIDFFAAIHTGILGSISARTYLFETLQHRTDIRLLRQQSNTDEPKLNFSRDHQRFHAINDEEQTEDGSNNEINAVARTLSQVDGANQAPVQVENKQVLDAKDLKASTIVIKSGYGICLDARCER